MVEETRAFIRPQLVQKTGANPGCTPADDGGRACRRQCGLATQPPSGLGHARNAIQAIAAARQCPHPVPCSYGTLARSATPVLVVAPVPAAPARAPARHQTRRRSLLDREPACSAARGNQPFGAVARRSGRLPSAAQPIAHRLIGFALCPRLAHGWREDSLIERCTHAIDDLVVEPFVSSSSPDSTCHLPRGSACPSSDRSLDSRLNLCAATTLRPRGHTPVPGHDPRPRPEGPRQPSVSCTRPAGTGTRSVAQSRQAGVTPAPNARPLADVPRARSARSRASGARSRRAPAPARPPERP